MYDKGNQWKGSLTTLVRHHLEIDVHVVSIIRDFEILDKPNPLYCENC